MAEMKFEKALQRLEQIVAELEKGELDIDKSLQIFEEGIKMSRICSKKLQEAEQKIETLTRNQKGELVAELFGGEAALDADDDEDDDDEEEDS
ncbi:exodeoxyribonuclease VII small subunit [Nitrospina watsonii]|uniref:Exodeoxyribonuclease 7 small subunit n=1 Tax=Nitrospina watsonii TaxID=1323948 RepID=A0ABM9H9T7_9BACT|nr:exodeoxyribonuclease VII small subunit [Nitrospina watsonii]CAI2716914.1 Exodeoxyribonuclease 7 small subunit [Nitrospina watsonii]